MDTSLRSTILSALLLLGLVSCGGGSGSSDKTNGPQQPILGSDSTLSMLSISSGTIVPSFSPATTNYEVLADSASSSIVVTPTTADPSATVTVNGVSVASGSASQSIALSVGSNTVNVVVTAENGSANRNYSLAVYRRSSDASLSTLQISEGTLQPDFSANQFDYSVDVDGNVENLTLTPISSDPNASITINGVAATSGMASGPITIALGSTNISITVTAEDGITTQGYSLTITRPSNDASLSSLSISPGAFDQLFQPALFNYTASAGFTETSVEVTALATDSNATLEINGASTQTGGASELIILSEGLNTVTVTVTAEDGVTNQAYLIEITRQSATGFAQQAYIKSSNSQGDDRFGSGAIALDGDTLAVGAINEASSASGINGNEADNSAPSSGAVYVFVRDGAGTWQQQAYLKSSDGKAGDQFGFSLSLHGDVLAVGAPYAGINGDNSGRAYVFRRDGSGVWSEEQMVFSGKNINNVNDHFGFSVSLGTDESLGTETLAVGAPFDDMLGIDAGVVWILERQATGFWRRITTFSSGGGTGGDNFGYSVSLFDDTLAVGAPREDGSGTGITCCGADNSAKDAGAVFIFERDASGFWSGFYTSFIKATNTETAASINDSDYFGWSVSLAGDTLAVGAPNEDSNVSGVSTDPGSLDNSAKDSGAVYIYDRDWSQTDPYRGGDSLWIPTAYVKASNSDQGDNFGSSLSLSPDNLVVGAWQEGSSAIGLGGDQSDNSASKSGAAYIFTRDGSGAWSQFNYAKASNGETADEFGLSVAIDGDTVAIAAPAEDSSATGVDGDQTNNNAPDSGAVYVFQ